MSFPVSLDATKSLGNRLDGDRMVGSVKPDIAATDAPLKLDETKILGARLNGANMVGSVKPDISTDRA